MYEEDSSPFWRKALVSLTLVSFVSECRTNCFMKIWKCGDSQVDF